MDENELPKEPAGRFAGRWNLGFEERHDIERPPAPQGGGVAAAEGKYTPDNVAKVESFRAAGHVKVAGKHLIADGLVSRRGKRRIVPDSDSALWDARAGQVVEAAKEVLRGRDASIFERRMQGVGFEALAEQFGRSVGFVHGAFMRGKEKVMEAIKQKQEPIPGFGHCPTCGFVYRADSFNQLPCDRGYGGYMRRETLDKLPDECARRFVKK